LGPGPLCIKLKSITKSFPIHRDRDSADKRKSACTHRNGNLVKVLQIFPCVLWTIRVQVNNDLARDCQSLVYAHNQWLILASHNFFRSHNTGGLMLDALFHAISSMNTHVAPVNLPLRRANAHNALCLIFAEPYFLRLPQNSFAYIVEKVPQDNERECERIHPVNMQMEDVEANNHALSNFSQTRKGYISAGVLLTQKLPVNNEMLKKAALDRRYKIGTMV
jgi:hypothetical protein